MSLHTWCGQGSPKPSSCAIFTVNSHWAELPLAKKPCVYVSRITSVVSNALRPCTLCLPGFSVREGGSPGKNSGVYWPILVAIPFESTIFPATLAASSLEYWVLPEPLQPKQLHHLHTWPSQGQTQVLQGSLRSKPQWMTLMQRWK